MSAQQQAVVVQLPQTFPGHESEIDLDTHVFPLLELVRYAAEAELMIGSLKEWQSSINSQRLDDLISRRTPDGHGYVHEHISATVFAVQDMLRKYQQQNKGVAA